MLGKGVKPPATGIDLQKAYLAGVGFMTVVSFGFAILGQKFIVDLKLFGGHRTG
jgi:hypothetical protein